MNDITWRVTQRIIDRYCAVFPNGIVVDGTTIKGGTPGIIHAIRMIIRALRVRAAQRGYEDFNDHLKVVMSEKTWIEICHPLQSQFVIDGIGVPIKIDDEVLDDIVFKSSFFERDSMILL